jgi:hypothetical protein
MLPKLTAAAVLVVLSAGAARAQVTDSLPGYGPDYRDYPVWTVVPDYDQTRSPEQLQRDREIERRYNETLKTKIPDKKASNDPWRTVRQAPKEAPPPDRHRPE